MPVKPKKILKALYLFNLSFRNSIAKRAVQIGAVNSIAKTSAKGKKATPYSQPVWPPKWIVFLSKCNFVCVVFTFLYPVKIKTSDITNKQIELRANDIWNAFNSEESSRPAIAIPEIDTSAPIIHKLARSGRCFRRLIIQSLCQRLKKNNVNLSKFTYAGKKQSLE